MRCDPREYAEVVGVSAERETEAVDEGSVVVVIGVRRSVWDLEEERSLD